MQNVVVLFCPYSLSELERSSRVSGCEVSKEARDPVGIASRLVEARSGFEPVEQIVGRQSVPLDRLRVAIGDLDREFAGDRETRRFDRGEWACPLGLLAGTL